MHYPLRLFRRAERPARLTRSGLSYILTYVLVVQSFKQGFYAMYGRYRAPPDEKPSGAL